LKNTVIIAFLLFLILLTSCQGMQHRLQPYIEDAGDVVLYLQPFPQEADRIRFTIEGIAARGSDGREFPFNLRLSELKGRELTRQRLLGAIQLPPGSYSGFSLKVKDAYLRGEEGDAALMAPDIPVRIDFFFTVIRRKGLQADRVHCRRFQFPAAVLASCTAHADLLPRGVCIKLWFRFHYGFR
jgi:hypothetical protein